MHPEYRSDGHTDDGQDESEAADPGKQRAFDVLPRVLLRRVEIHFHTLHFAGENLIKDDNHHRIGSGENEKGGRPSRMPPIGSARPSMSGQQIQTTGKVRHSLKRISIP